MESTACVKPLLKQREAVNEAAGPTASAQAFRCRKTPASEIPNNFGFLRTFDLAPSVSKGYTWSHEGKRCWNANSRRAGASRRISQDMPRAGSSRRAGHSGVHAGIHSGEEIKACWSDRECQRQASCSRGPRMNVVEKAVLGGQAYVCIHSSV